MLKLFRKKEEQKEFDKEELFSCLKKDGIKLKNEDLQKARNKDGKILHAVGTLYYDKKDYPKALAWYRLAATQNFSKAQNNIGLMYEKGLGVAQDYQQAMEWFLKAANNDGYSKAQHNIGYLYKSGYGVPKNIHTAIEWLTKSANQGDSEDQYLLGVVYEKYREVKDLQKAIKWYKTAYDNGYEFAKDDIARLNKKGYFSKNEKAEKNQEETNEESLQVPQLMDLNDTRRESDDRVVSNSNQQEQLLLTNQNEENKALEMEERLKKLEEAFQQKMDILERENMALEQVRSEHNHLKENFNLLEEEKKMIASERDKKDEEINQLKEALAHHRATLDDNTNNDFNYDSSNDNEDTDDKSDTNKGCNTEYGDSDEDGHRENDINYDSSDSEDRSNDLNYD